MCPILVEFKFLTTLKRFKCERLTSCLLASGTKDCHPKIKSTWKGLNSYNL